MPGPLSPVGLIIRTLLLGGLLTACGAIAFRFFILVPLARRGEQPRELAARMAGRVAAFAMAGSTLVLVMAIARLLLQLRELTDPLSGERPDAGFLIGGTTWGRAWIVQLVGAALLFAALALRRWVPAALLAVVVAFTPAFSGHAIGSERLVAVAVIADGLHTIAASAWIGAMLMLGVTLLMPRQSGQLELMPVIIAAFSPLALSAAATVAFTGALGGWLHLGSLQALVGSRYGRTLLLKVGLVLAVAGIGAFNWKRAGPQAQSSADERPMLRSVRTELTVAVLVLVATAVLIVTPPAGEE